MNADNINVKIDPITKWLSPNKGPLIIAGPCSAETEDQVLVTARALAECPMVRVFRAGIWKPRTRPSSFEGVGEAGLDWLVAAKAETGLPLAVEVATAAHVESCLKKGIDALWIGARTVGNPFSMQEVANALAGCDVPIFVKNPLVPELPLWVGAFERLNAAGITKLVGVHRGFANYLERRFRYSPEWSIPNQLRELIPGLPILCDPSHIAGKRELISGIAKEALSLKFNGLMIETHITPESAWSDADQQLSPKALVSLLSDLGISSSHSASTAVDGMSLLENRLQHLDRRLFEIISARLKLIQDIKTDGGTNNVIDLQIRKIDELLAETLKKSGKAMKLDEQFVATLINFAQGEATNARV